MSAADQLAELYERWRQLTEAEAAAIRRGAWEQLAEAQSAKANLQPLVTQAGEKLRQEVAPFAQRETVERRFQAVVEELIQLEQKNGELLAARRHTAETQKADLERTGRNLRQLHRSYASGAAAAHWQSYS